MTLERLNDIQNNKWGGKRTGAGRPLHSKNPNTIEREEAARVFKERVAKHADRLFDAQMDLAVGEKYLFVKTTTGTGKNRKSEITIVTNTETIKQFLDDDLENSDTEYYFMTTKPANNMALDSLLNRSFGKAEEKLDITSKGDALVAADPLVAQRFAEFLKSDTQSS